MGSVVPSKKAITKVQAIIIVVFIGISLVLASVFGVYLWNYWRNPVLSYYNVERITMNELQDGEGFSANGESWDGDVIYFSQKLHTYCGAEGLLKLEMVKEGNLITITETYDSEEAVENVCPYQVTGKIKHLKEGAYTIKIVFVDKYADETEMIHETTVTVEKVPD